MSNTKLYILLTFLLALSICEQVKSQDVHGYSMVLANELSDHNFIVTDRGYVDTVDLYKVRLETPDFYDEELTRTVITSVLAGYSDVKRYEPWERSYGGTSSSSYRINDTELDISIFEHSTDSYGLNQGCTVLLFEFINPDWIKSKSTGTKKKKTTKSSKKKSTKRR